MMPRRQGSPRHRAIRLWSAAAVAFAAMSAVAAAQSADDDRQLFDLLERVGTYARQFEQKLALVVADEEYEQKTAIRDDRGRKQTNEEQRMRSELLILWLIEEDAWLTVRNVLSVNRDRVPDSTNRLDTFLAIPRREDFLERLRQHREDAVRYNIGHVYRNFNDPLFVLEFLDPVHQDRFTFSIQGRATIDGIDTIKLSFVETTKPAMIRSATGDLLSSGMVWMNPADGSLVRTHLTLSEVETNTHGSIVVDYRPNAKLGIRTPVRMTERYTRDVLMNNGVPGRAISFVTMTEEIECVATYSNFRRVEAAARYDDQ
jgi:hypothetical protein